MNHNYCLSILFNNKPGFIIRVALVLERRGHSIHSITIAERAHERFSRMTLIGSGNPEKLEQIVKQLAKLVDVVSIDSAEEHMTSGEEAALIPLSSYGAESFKVKTAAIS